MGDALHFDLLDHGHLSEVEHWGSDERIIESARMSTGGGFRGWAKATCQNCGEETEPHADFLAAHSRSPGLWDLPCDVCGGDVKIETGDEKLLGYLYRNKHATPFEMAGITIEVKAPIIVFRQWHRHRTQGYNEMSARYTPLPDENYRPLPERCIVVPGENKQARGAVDRVPTHEEVLDWLDNYLDTAYQWAQRAYARGLQIGVPKEIARLPVPVARYSIMRATANLRNWLAFMTLRSDPHAQEEIRVYSDAIGKVVAERFPRTWDLFVEGQRR